MEFKDDGVPVNAFNQVFLWSGADKKPRLEKMCLDLLNEAINSPKTSEPRVGRCDDKTLGTRLYFSSQQQDKHFLHLRKL